MMKYAVKIYKFKKVSYTLHDWYFLHDGYSSHVAPRVEALGG